MIPPIDWSSDKESVTLTNFRVTFGEGTPYEAEAHIINFEDGWNGFMIFKSHTLSPVDPAFADFPIQYDILRLRYALPEAGCGALAHTRAENYWNDLVRVFQMVEVSGVNHG